VVYGDFNYNFSPIRKRKHNCMFFMAKGNVMIAGWSVCALTAHAVAASLRNTATDNVRHNHNVITELFRNLRL
jgi:hypothetical protein